MTIIAKARRKDWMALLDAAAKKEPALAREIANAILSIRDKIPIVGIGRAISEGRVSDALGMIPLESLDDLAKALPEHLRGVLEGAAKSAQPLMPKEASGIRFDVFNPRAVDWMRRRGGNLVTEIGDETLKDIRQAIAEAFQEGIPPAKAAGKIRDMIGLTDRQQRALENYRDTLIAEGAKDIEAKLRRFSERQLRIRAKMIARTEIKTAANQGQQMLWQQAMDEGLLDKAARKKWLLSFDPCERICKPIPGMNPAGVPVAEPFQTPKGPIMTPAAHPNCRCGLGLIVPREQPSAKPKRPRSIPPDVTVRITAPREISALSVRAERAIRTYNPVTAEKVRIAKTNERMIAKIIGGDPTPDNDPFDVIAKKMRVGVEVKTLVNQTNDKITMHPESLRRKVKAAKQLKVNPFTVVIDQRAGGKDMFVRQGLGSFRLGKMDPIEPSKLKDYIKTRR